MKKLIRTISMSCLLTGLVGLMNFSASAANGYTLHVTILHAQDSVLQLCHFYGRPGLVNIDTTFKIKPGAKSTFTLRSTKPLVGGLYLLLFKNKRSQMEMVLNNGEELTLQYDFDKPVETAQVTGSKDFKDYIDYQRFLLPYNQKFKQLEDDRKKARTKADSALVKEQGKKLNGELEAYRDSYAEKNPSSFMASLFRASKYKEIPESISNDEEKKNKFIREHIFDGFDFNDQRLANTPFLENKLSVYLSSAPQTPDSINAISDELLSRMKNAPELFKLTVAWMVRSQENVKASFGDDCFIYLIEKYYLNGKTDLINDSTRNSYAKKIAMLSHNVIGVKAPDFTVLNRNEESVALKSIYAAHEYTLLMFWSPTCNHCTDEVPLLDSAVASLGKDIAIVGIDAHGEGPDWKKWISSHTFKANWIHLYDPERKSSFVSDYSVYTTPVLYLLDRKGTIVAKRIMHFNLKETLTDLASAKKK